MVVLVIGFGNCIRWGKVDELNLDNFEGFLKPQDMGQAWQMEGPPLRVSQCLCGQVDGKIVSPVRSTV